MWPKCLNTRLPCSLLYKTSSKTWWISALITSLSFQILQLATAPTWSRHAPDEFRRRSVSYLESITRRRFWQLGSTETRHGNHRTIDHDTSAGDATISRVKPETEIGWKFWWSPALLHVLDDVCPNFCSLHIAHNLRSRTCRNWPLQKGWNGKTHYETTLDKLKSMIRF